MDVEGIMRWVFVIAAAVSSSQLSARHNRVCRSSDRTQSIDLNSLVELALPGLPEQMVVAAAGLVVMVVAAVVLAVTVGQIADYLWIPTYFVLRTASPERLRTDFRPDYTNWNIVQSRQPRQQIHLQMFVVLQLHQVVGMISKTDR